MQRRKGMDVRQPSAIIQASRENSVEHTSGGCSSVRCAKNEMAPIRMIRNAFQSINSQVDPQLARDQRPHVAPLSELTLIAPLPPTQHLSIHFQSLLEE